MRTSKKVKCPICETFNNKEETVLHNQRYYCKVCYENKRKESDDYKQLCEYICQLYDIEAPTGWMLKQIKDYKEQFNYTYKGIKTTLNYFYEIKEGNSPEDSMGIGIVPFIYDEAKRFYIERKAIKESAETCDINKLQEDCKIIKIKYRDLPVQKSYKDIAIIDITQL